MKAALPPGAAGKPVEIWFQDEARVGQQGTLTRIWARRGSRPRKPRDRRYSWAYLFGAVCPARGTGAAVVLPWVNAEAMSEHLAAISTQVAAGAHAVIVLDGAGWHQQGGRLHVPANLTLRPLPPYAPELNPRRKHLGVSPWQPTQHHRLGQLRADRRSLLPRLEQPHARTLSHQRHRITTLGTSQTLRPLV